MLLCKVRGGRPEPVRDPATVETVVGKSVPPFIVQLGGGRDIYMEKRTYLCEAKIVHTPGSRTSLMVRGMVMSEDRNSAKKEFEAECKRRNLPIEEESVFARGDEDSVIMLRSGMRR